MLIIQFYFTLIIKISFTYKLYNAYYNKNIFITLNHNNTYQELYFNGTYSKNLFLLWWLMLMFFIFVTINCCTGIWFNINKYSGCEYVVKNVGIY